MKKAICLILALLFAAGANLHLCARVSAGDETAAGVFSLAALVRGVFAAEAAAAELTEARPPGLRVRPALSLRPPSEEAAAVSDLLLRHTEGVAVRTGCRVDGVWLGCTAEGEELAEALRRHIFGTRPPGALSGHFDGELELAPVYTRPGRETSPGDLCMLVTGLLPVIYTDPSGAVVG